MNAWTGTFSAAVLFTYDVCGARSYPHGTRHTASCWSLAPVACAKIAGQRALSLGAAAVPVVCVPYPACDDEDVHGYLVCRASSPPEG